MRWRRRSRCSRGCASRARRTKRASPRSSGGFRSSSTPACASSPNSPRCGPSSSSGTKSPATASASRIPSKRRFRYGVQVNSLGLTEQQPENNAYRILIEMLSVVLSRGARARAVQLPAWNEALGLPRPFDQQWSLRLQQIMAYETDLLEFGDIFDGSTGNRGAGRKAQGRSARRARLDRRGRRRGQGDRIGRPQGEAGGVATRAGSRRSSAAKQIVVGVNAFTNSEPSPLTAGEEFDPGSLGRSRGGTDRSARRVAGRPRSEARARGAAGAAFGGGQRRQYHARLDRGGQGRRHHRRMGRRAEGRIRRVSRADRRFAESPPGGRATSTRCAARSSACR